MQVQVKCFSFVSVVDDDGNGDNDDVVIVGDDELLYIDLLCNDSFF